MKQTRSDILFLTNSPYLALLIVCIIYKGFKSFLQNAIGE